MNLRTRLLTGYGYLVTLLVIGAAAAAIGFQQLGHSIRLVLDENVQSLRASTQMLEALERQDSALLGILLGDPQAAELLAAAELAFAEAYAEAEGNITIAGEAPLLDQIGHGYEGYILARNALVQAVPEHPLRAYNEQVFPRFSAVKAGVIRLLDLNHEAMVDADEATRQQARRHALGHGLLVTVALLSLGFVSQHLRHHLLDRLSELRRVAAAVAAGERWRRAPGGEEDELGVVARQLNEALDAEAALEGAMSAHLNEQRQLLLGLLHSLGEPAALLGLDRELMASTLDNHALLSVLEAAASLPDGVVADPTSQAPIEVALRDAGVRFRRLLASGVRPVGWLATVERATDAAAGAPQGPGGHQR